MSSRVSTRRKRTLVLAKGLRKRMTDTERILWKHLRAKRFGGLKFKRQAPIGRYIVDFLCMEKNLVIELDGYSHILREKKDVARDMYLEESGFIVLRFPNTELIESLENVLSEIALKAKVQPSSLSLLPKGEGQGEGSR